MRLYLVIYICSLLAILYLISCNKQYETFQTPYSLGDIIRMQPWTLKSNYINSHSDTIGYEYRKNTNKKNDYITLKNICDKRKNILNGLPRDNELIIHIRLGDVIENSIYTVDELLKEEKLSKGRGISNRRNYIKSRHFFENYILNEIKNKPIDTVVFISGDHKNLNSLKKTHEYLTKVSNIFKMNGYDIKIKFNEHTADEDFVYLSNSKYFAPTGGGFSQAVIELVKLNNNVVFDKYFDSVE